MRKILFRGKCEKGYDYSNGDGWVYGSLLTDGEQCGIVKYEDMQFGYSPDDGLSSQPDFAFIPCIPETVGQFTGFTDINGMKIFEGDKFGGGIVVYDEHYCAFMIDFPHRSKKMYFENIVRIEITGNIHDNQ